MLKLTRSTSNRQIFVDSTIRNFALIVGDSDTSPGHLVTILFLVKGGQRQTDRLQNRFIQPCEQGAVKWLRAYHEEFLHDLYDYLAHVVEKVAYDIFNKLPAYDWKRCRKGAH